MTLIPKLTGTAFQIDLVFAAVFIALIVLFLFKNKKNVKFERMLFPFIYSFLYRGKFGIKRMEKFSKKNKELIKILGYISIGVGFIGMFFATIMVFYIIIQAFLKPKVSTVAPFLPFVNVPVLGYISFSHWIITIFIVVLVHEAGHGIVALSNGLKIKNTGAGIFAILIPFMPAAFVEPDEVELKKKSDVVQYSIFAAGPMANFLLIIPLALILLLVINPIESHITYQDGVMFDVIDNESYPAYNYGLKNGTIVTSINGNSILTYDDFYKELQFVRPGENVSFTNISGDTFVLTTTNYPDYESRGFIGVTSIKNNIVIKKEALPYVPYFSWFKGLIMLMINITFSLGLINLFPASITDGGRMFSLALNRISKNKEMNKWIVIIFALILVALILYAMTSYVIGLF